MPARPAAVAGGAGIRCPPLQLPRAARAGYRHDHTAPEPTEVQPRSSLLPNRGSQLCSSEVRGTAANTRSAISNPVVARTP